MEAKNYLAFEHAFVMVPSFFERNLHCHARVCMSRVHQSVARDRVAMFTQAVGMTASDYCFHDVVKQRQNNHLSCFSYRSQKLLLAY